MKAAELEAIVDSLLENGVPASVVARVFDLDHDLVKRRLSDVRVARYGTDDMTEYMEQLQWDAVDEARQLIAKGSAAEKSRMLGMVLGKQVALAARRTPQGVRDSQDALMDLLDDMRTSTPKTDIPRSRFVAKLGNGVA